MANLSELGRALETTRDWINELMITLGTDEATAFRTLRVVLHELRDQLTLEETADLAAQLPVLIRGYYYEGWRPMGSVAKHLSREDFIDKVGESFEEASLDDVEKRIRDVFVFLDRRVSAGEIQHVVKSLPKGLRNLWPAYLHERHTG